MKHGEVQGCVFFSNAGIHLSRNVAHVHTVTNPAFEIAKCFGVSLPRLVLVGTRSRPLFLTLEVALSFALILDAVRRGVLCTLSALAI